MRSDSRASNPPPGMEMKPMDNAGEFRSGFVALAGRPNAGKSTLLNAVVGENIAVVTSLPQTTRKNFKGVYSEDNLQVVFIDTPGIHAGKYSLNEAMVLQAEKVLSKTEADILCYIVDLSRAFGDEEDYVAKLAEIARIPRLIVFNKEDLCSDPKSAVDSFFQRYPRLSSQRHVVLSATSKTAPEVFLSSIRSLVPVGPPLFPIDDLTDENMRFFAAEYLRKQVILHTRQEVPHASCVEIESYRETPEKHYIDATIHVETTGQRGIVVGPRGSLIKRIRRFAEKELAELAGVPVSIKCHIKVSPRWRDNPRFLRDLGYSVPKKK